MQSLAFAIVATPMVCVMKTYKKVAIVNYHYNLQSKECSFPSIMIALTNVASN